MHYQIEYYNKMWKDWLAFDQLFYKTEEDAQKRIDEYKEHNLGTETRIVQTNILNEKPRRTTKKNLSSVRVERL